MYFEFIRNWRWEFALAGAVLVSAAVLVAAEMGYDRTLTAHEKITSVSENSQSLSQLLGSLTDAETAQRRYLLTRRDSYLEPYLHGVAGSRLMLKTLVLRYQNSGDGEGFARIGRIATLSNEQFAALESALSQARQGDLHQAPEIFNADSSRNKMAELRNEVQALLDHNRARAIRLRQESVEITHYARLSVALISTINIVLLVIVFRRLGEGWRQKEQEAEQLKAQQDRLDAQVRERTAQLEYLSIHLQDVIEGEKIRVARDLHDELGSVLTAAKMDITWVRDRLGKTPSEMDEKLQRTLNNIDQGILVKRRLIEDLRPGTLFSFGLVAAARELAEDSAARNAWTLALDLPDAEPAIGPDTATALYRVLQEALTNASKYAQAKNVSIRLATVDQELRLEIVDDGVGFRLPDIRPKAFGLMGMRQRLQARGGSFEIATHPGAGCRVRVILPLQQKEKNPTSPEINAAIPAAFTPGINAPPRFSPE